ncbi:MAG: glycosyltransferase family 39 protein [bacterium]|nr:glycosyltransferase family 39 protein [bacterium]
MKKLSNNFCLMCIFISAFLFRLKIILEKSYGNGHEDSCLGFASSLNLSEYINNNYIFESNGILHIVLLKYWNLLYPYFLGISNKVFSFYDYNYLIHGRLLSLLFGMLTLIFLYMLGCKVLGKNAGVYSVFFLAIFSEHICLSSYIRFYAINCCFCVLASYFLVKMIDSDRFIWFILYILTFLLCISSMMLSAVLLVPHALYYVRKKGFNKRLFILIIIILVDFVFWWLMDSVALSRKSVYYDCIGTRGFLLLVSTVLGSCNYYLDMLPHYFCGSLYKCAYILMILNNITAICVIVLGFTIFLKNMVKKNKCVGFLEFSSIWVVVPCIILMFIHFSIIDILNRNNISFILPGVCLALGELLSMSRCFRWILLTSMILWIPLSINDSYAWRYNDYMVLSITEQFISDNDVIVNYQLDNAALCPPLSMLGKEITVIKAESGEDFVNNMQSALRRPRFWVIGASKNKNSIISEMEGLNSLGANYTPVLMFSKKDLSLFLFRSDEKSSPHR